MSDARQLEVVVNGRRRSFAGAISVEELVRAVECDPRTVAVERNGSIVRRADYSSTRLDDGDQVEIVRFVQGG